MTKLTEYQDEGIRCFFEAMDIRLHAVNTVLKKQVPREHKDHARWAAEVYAAWSWTGYFFAWAVGAGKTLTSLTIMYRWREWVTGLHLSDELESELLKPFLIVGPAANRHVWEQQAITHKVPLALFTVETDDQYELAVRLLNADGVDGLVVSYTGLARNGVLLAPYRFGLGVFDEGQKLANASTKQAQSVYEIAQMRHTASLGVAVRLALSGTPFLNHVEQLWPPLAFLQGYARPRKGKSGIHYTLYSTDQLWYDQNTFERSYCDKTFNAFGRTTSVKGKNLYHDPKNNPYCRTHKADQCGCLYNRMSRLVMHRVTTEEANRNIPESPPPEWIEVPLGRKQSELYRHVVDRAELPISDNGRAGSLAVARMALLTYGFEICASVEQLRESLRARDGRLDLNFGQVPLISESTKLDQIVDMVSEFDAPCLIFTGFARFARQIAHDRRLQEYKPLLLAGTGNLSAREFEAQMQTGEHRIGVMTTMGATGLNLQVASYVIVAGFFDWSPLQVSQAIGRSLRQGQKRRVLSYMLYAPHTLEQWWRAKLAAKMDAFTAAIDGRAGGAEDLGLGNMSDNEFANLFHGG